MTTSFINRITLSLFSVLIFSTLTLAQDDWKEYYSDDFKIKFSIPSNWEVEIKENEVFGVSNENMVGFLLISPSKDLPAENWNSEIQKRIAFNNFEFTSENQSLELNNLKILASEGTGYGLEYETQIYFYLITIVRDENPLIAFTFCPLEDLPRNEKTMKEILLSFANPQQQTKEN